MNVDRFELYEDDTAQVECPVCHEITTVRVIDDGIGFYEFWGDKGLDKKFILVTSCCNEEVRKEELK